MTLGNRRVEAADVDDEDDTKLGAILFSIIVFFILVVAFVAVRIDRCIMRGQWVRA